MHVLKSQTPIKFINIITKYEYKLIYFSQKATLYVNKPFRHFISLAGKTDPYVTMILGDQVIKSKKNSQTTVTGLPEEPIWNQVVT
jgi:hypothetical protein